MNNNMADTASDNDLLESAFAHIKKGNDAKENGMHWDSTYEYEMAHQKLNQLVSSKTQNAAEHVGGEEEAAKIAALYRDRSREYFNRARKALITAMLNEHEKDTTASLQQKDDEEEEGKKEVQDIDISAKSHILDQYHYGSLSDEELDRRLSIFARLFAREQQQLQLASGSSTAAGAPGSSSTDDVRDIEQRLMSLNENLPSGFKTSEQRMRDLNKGLNRLGFSLYSAADENKKFGSSIDPLPKSEEEQVAEIMAQATDEVAIMGTTAGGNNNEDSKVVVDADGLLNDESDLLDKDHDDDDSSSSHTTEDDEEEALTPDKMNRIRDYAVDAQAQLAQLIALLEVDGGGDAEIEFEPGVGKRALTLARTSLAKANREWNNKDDRD